MALILHAGKTNKNAFKTLIVAECSGVEVTLVENFEMGVSNKTPGFLKMNPIGKVGFNHSIYAKQYAIYFNLPLIVDF
uniref:Elongation factor 1-gamma 1 family protein Gamma class glutathione transferase EF1Bgamma2 n=1 Tax=Rhizophora mucronata TaxID=61149 RepID=A0A2P2MBJ5_RHIMU